MLDAFHRAQQARGWQVVGLAVDSPTPVREFLRDRPMGFAIGLAGMTGVDLTRRLGNTNGACPSRWSSTAPGAWYSASWGR